jgi:hypothetical protein
MTESSVCAVDSDSLNMRAATRAARKLRVILHRMRVFGTPSAAKPVGALKPATARQSAT